MRVSFSPGDPRQLKELMAGDVKFIDVLVTRGAIFFAVVTSTLYVHKGFPTLSLDDFERPVTFRVEKKEFLSLLMEGVVTFYTDLSTVLEIKIESKQGLTFELTKEYQSSNEGTLHRYRDIIAQQHKFTKIQTKQLVAHSSLLRAFNTKLDVLDGVAQTDFKNVSCFIECDVPNFSITNSTLLFILKHCKDVYLYQDFMIGSTEDSYIIALQTIPKGFSDYRFVKATRPQAKTVINPSSVVSLARRISLEGTLYVDFNRGIAKATSFTGTQISVPVDVKSRQVRSDPKSKETVDLDALDLATLLNQDAVVQEKRKIPSLVLPSALFSSYLPSVGSKAVEFRIATNTILVIPELPTKGGVVFVTGRKDVEL